MKTKLLLISLLAILATTGSTCINDGFLVAVNLPINPCFTINAGPTLTFNRSITDTLALELDQSYRENIKSARYYDIRVSVIGTYNGTVNGTVYIQGPNSTTQKALLTFTGNWADFSAPQSLLGSSPHIATVPVGVQELLNALNNMTVNPNTAVTISAVGALNGQSPVPPGLSVCVEILGQVDAKVQ